MILTINFQNNYPSSDAGIFRLLSVIKKVTPSHFFIFANLNVLAKLVLC